MQENEPRATLCRLAATAARALAHDELDPATREKAALCLMDYLACSLESVSTAVGEVAKTFTRDRRAIPEAHVFGVRHRVDAETAALANGILGHGIIREDMHVESGCHPAPAILAAMLALAQRESLDGRALVRGIVAGYQVLGTLGAAVIGSTTNRRFRPLGIAGAYGVAAGCIAATDLEEERAVHALAVAANTAAGVNQWPWSAGQEIYLHAGIAARNGLAAFDLARAGLRASEDVLEGTDGFFAAYDCRPGAADVFRKRIGHRHHILNVTHKPVAGCNYAQAPAGAARTLRLQLPSGETRAIRRITIGTFAAAAAYPGCDCTGPFRSVEQTKMSIQFMVAASLRHGVMGEAAYRGWEDAETMWLVGVATLQVDPSFEADAPRLQGASVRVELADGTTLSAHAPDVPWLAPAGVVERFVRATETCLPRAAAGRVQLLAQVPW
jgi:2-methylcitrate dehydratase PrpD